VLAAPVAPPPAYALTASMRRHTAPYGTGLFAVDAGSGASRALGRFLASAPSWSPDGRRVAFGRRHAIWAADANGRHLRRLSPPWIREARRPVWSPDGTAVAFVCSVGDAIDGVCTVRSDGTGGRRLTRPTPPVWIVEAPSWTASLWFHLRRNQRPESTRVNGRYSTLRRHRTRKWHCI